MLHMRRVLSVLAFGLVSVALLAVSGCGPSRAAVSGTLVMPPDVKLQDDDSVTIMFTPDEAGVGGSLATFNNKDHTFTVKAPDGNNPPTGKYHITVSVLPYNSGDQARKNELQQAFTPYATKEASKLEYTVGPESKQKITIDLTTPPGKVGPG